MKTTRQKFITYILLLFITFLSLNTIYLKSLDNYYITSKQEFINYLLHEDADMEASYILTTDLDFTKGTVVYKGETINLENQKLVVQPIGERKNDEGKVLSSYYNPFKGSFNGSGYVIKGLYIKSASEDNEYVGLFGYNQGIITNLGLVDSTVEGGIHVGGIAGYNIGIIMGCYNTSTIIGIGTVGGITGINYGYIRNSYNTGYVGGATKVGGIVGQNSSVVSAVYDIGIISGEITEDGLKEYGYIFGYNSEQGVIGYVESDTGKRFFNPFQYYEEAGAYYSLEYDLGVGYNVGYNVGSETRYDNVNVYGKPLESLKNINTYDSGFRNPKYNIKPIGSDLIHQTTGFYIRQNSSYQFPVVGISEQTTRDHVENSLNKNGFSGAGTLYNPFLIEDEDDLQNINKSLTSAYKLANDILITKPFIPIGEENNEFKGILNGNGKRIINLQLISNEEIEYLGLFAFNSGIVHNLSMDVTIETPNASKIGAIAGFNNGQIYEVYVMGEIKGNSTVGGIVGTNELGLIKNSYNLANIYGDVDIGGIAGFNSGKVEFVYNANNPRPLGQTEAKNLGAIIGYNENTTNPNNVSNAIFYEINQIGYQSKTEGPYSNLTNKAETYDDLKNIQLYIEFDITEISSGSTASTIWAKEFGVNNYLPYLTKTPLVRVKEVVVDKTKQIEIDGGIIKLFDEEGRLKLGNQDATYANEIDLNYFVSVLPLNAENKKINYYVLSGNDKVELNGSILKGLINGNAIIKAVSEDGSKEAIIEVVITDKIHEVYFVDENGNQYNDEIEVENFDEIYIIPKTNVDPLNYNDLIIEISENNFLVNKGNFLYKFNYLNPSNLVVSGRYTNEVSLTITITAKDNTSISNQIKVILKPSSKKYTNELITLREYGVTLNHEVNGNLIKLKNDTLIKYNTDYVVLELNPSYLQKVTLSSAQSEITNVSTLIKNIYLKKGDLVDGKLVNRVNEIEVDIVAEDGSSEKFTLQLTKDLSPIVDLKEITFNDGTKNYSYTRVGDKFIINEFVPFDVTQITITALLNDVSSSYSKSLAHKIYYFLQGEAKQEDGLIILNNPLNHKSIFIEVISEANTTKVYEVEFYYDFEKIDKLQDLFIGEYGKENKINFDKDVNDYHISLTKDANIDYFLSYTTYPNANQRVFVVIDEGSKIYSNNINFVAAYSGLTLVWVFVQSSYNYKNNIEDYNIYLITIVREENDEAYLTELKVNNDDVAITSNMTHSLDPSFYGNGELLIKGSRFANIEVTYLSFTEQMSGITYTFNLSLNKIDDLYKVNIQKGGNYLIKIVVTSEDKSSTNTYYLTLTKQVNTNPLFDKIVIDGVTYNNFIYDEVNNKYILLDEVVLAYEKSSISFQAYLDLNGYYEFMHLYDIFISGEVVTLNLNTGLNTFTLVSYAENYFYYANYEFTIKREYNSNTPYKVNHYTQNFDGTYSLSISEELTGLALSTVNAIPKEFTGFTLDLSVVDTLSSAVLLEDGSLVLKLFYKRNMYSLNVIYNNLYGEVTGEVGTIKYDYNVVLNAKANQGYKFLGWYLDGLLLSTNPIYEFKMPAENLNLYANFELDEYTITYHLNGGINHPSNRSTYNYFDLDVMLYEPVKEGFKFLGWYLNSDYSGNKVIKIDMNLLGNITLYARWAAFDEEEYQVHIYLEDLDGSFKLEKIENYSGYAGSYVEAVVRSFAGFTFDPSVSTTSGYISETTLILTLYYLRNTYTVNIVNENVTGGVVNVGTYTLKFEEELVLTATTNLGYIFTGWFINNDLISSELEYLYKVPSQDVVVIAKIEKRIYNINYVINVDAPNANPTTYTIDDLPLTITNLTKVGYIFSGWYLDSSLQGEAINLITVELIGDITLYGKFEINEYNVKLIIDGSIVDEFVLKHNEKIIFNDYSRIGYNLKAWYLDELLTTMFDVNSGITSDLIIYGSYELIEYEIIYHLDGGSIIPGFENPTKYTYESSEIILNPLEKVGYIFIGWFDSSNNQVSKIEANSIGNKELFAKFEIIKFEFRFIIGGKGKILVNDEEIESYTILIDYGSNVNLKFIADLDYVFSYFKINDVEYTEVSEIDITNVTSDYKIEVRFSGAEPDVLTLKEGSGYGDKVYAIDRTGSMNLFLNYYINQKVKDIRDCFINSPDRIKFYNTTGTELNDNSILGTGYVIKLFNSDYTEVIDEVVVVLVGDTSCDGVINALDINIVIRHVKLYEIIDSEDKHIELAANPLNLPIINALCINAIIRHVKLLELLYN